MRRRRSLREEIVIASRAVILALIIWRTRRDRGKVTHRPRNPSGETRAGVAGEGNALTAWGVLRPGPRGPQPAEPPASTRDTEMRRLGLRNRLAAGGITPRRAPWRGEETCRLGPHHHHHPGETEWGDTGDGTPPVRMAPAPSGEPGWGQRVPDGGMGGSRGGVARYYPPP